MLVGTLMLTSVHRCKRQQWKYEHYNKTPEQTQKSKPGHDELVLKLMPFKLEKSGGKTGTYSFVTVLLIRIKQVIGRQAFHRIPLKPQRLCVQASDPARVSNSEQTSRKTERFKNYLIANNRRK